MEAQPSLKRCTECGQEKPLEQFSKVGLSKPGALRAKCKGCTNIDNTIYRTSPGGRKRKMELVWKGQGIRFTYEEYLALEAAQEGRCANKACRCLPEEADRRARYLCVDHCHDTGTIRGLLCNRCNKALGNVSDNPARLLGLVQYLKPFSPPETSTHLDHVDACDL